MAADPQSTEPRLDVVEERLIEAFESKIGELIQSQADRPIEKVVAALSRAQASFTTVPKTKINPHFQSAYAALDDIVEMARPHLAKEQLAIVSQGVYHPKQGWQLVTRLYHSSGQYLESTLPLGSIDSPQKLGSHMTYMRRYAGSGLLSIVSDEDDDGNAAEGGATTEKRRQAASSSPRTRSTATTRKKAPARKPKDPDSKAGDGTPPKAKLTAFWPQVYATGAALGMDKDETVAWVREELKAKGFPASSKDLEQGQVNAVMKWLHDWQQDPKGEFVLAPWGPAEPEQQELTNEPPPPTDADAGPDEEPT